MVEDLQAINEMRLLVEPLYFLNLCVFPKQLTKVPMQTDASKEMGQSRSRVAIYDSTRIYLLRANWIKLKVYAWSWISFKTHWFYCMFPIRAVICLALYLLMLVGASIEAYPGGQLKPWAVIGLTVFAALVKGAISLGLYYLALYPSRYKKSSGWCLLFLAVATVGCKLYEHLLICRLVYNLSTFQGLKCGEIVGHAYSDNNF
jgi:hypothetical protein